MFVLDASVALSHSLAEPEFRDQARRIMAALETQTALVPAIWCLELASGLLRKERGKVVTKKEVDDTLLRWSKLPVKADTSGLAGAFTETLALARKHNISVYDASYVEVAKRHSLPIASFDTALREAAKREGVGCFDGPRTAG